MSDTKALNNQRDTDARRIAKLEQEVDRLKNQSKTATAAAIYEHIAAGKRDAEAEAKTYRRKYESACSERSYFRSELRKFGIQANAARAIEENLARRLEAHKRDAMPGDPIAAAALIECEAVLDLVKNITRGTDA